LAFYAKNALIRPSAGRVFVESGTEERKRLFREYVIRFVPLALASGRCSRIEKVTRLRGRGLKSNSGII
jgi:hypothetical protein